MRTSVAGISVVAVLLVSGCGSSVTSSAKPTITPAPTATKAPTATPASISTPAPTATADIAWVNLEPAAIIDVAGMGVIPTVTDGTTLWAAAPNALLKIDATTDSIERLDAPVMPDDTFLALASDGLWVTRWAGDKLYRLDPQTGDVELDSTLDTAVNLQIVGEDLWVGQEDKQSMFQVDRSTGEIDPTTQLIRTAYAASGLGDLWFVSDLHITRIDPQTQEVKATIDVSDQANCASGVGGAFPDSVWTGCFEFDSRERSIARIDPMTNAVATVARIPMTHGGSVITIDGQPWFSGSFEDPAGKHFAGLVRIDPATGAIDRFFSIAGADPDGSLVAGNALWIADEAGHRILKVNLADLGG